MMDDVKKLTDSEHSVSEALARKYRHVSRRSFFSRVTRIAFGVAGVALLDKAPLFGVPSEHDRLEGGGLQLRLLRGLLTKRHRSKNRRTT